MKEKNFYSAIELLKKQYLSHEWVYHNFSLGDFSEKMFRWPGIPDEEIMIVAHQSNGKQELFHRHDYFYFNYTWEGEYDSISFRYDNRITIRKGELYAGQPFAGHAMCVHDNQKTTIIGVLIQKNTFFRAFLPMLSGNTKFFHFLLDPVTNSFSEEFIHLDMKENRNLTALLEMMAIEYAYKKPDTQLILKSLTLAFLMQVYRQYTLVNEKPVSQNLSDKILLYIEEHFDSIALKDISSKFSYHPNYISALLHRETGKSFSEILLEKRMERAAILLENTTLSVESISQMLGYSNTSNFYKAFQKYFHTSPRQYRHS